MHQQASGMQIAPTTARVQVGRRPLISVQIADSVAPRLSHDWLDASTAAAALVLYLVPALLLQEAFPEVVSPAVDIGERRRLCTFARSAFFMLPPRDRLHYLWIQ